MTRQGGAIHRENGERKHKLFVNLSIPEFEFLYRENCCARFTVLIRSHFVKRNQVSKVLNGIGAFIQGDAAFNEFGKIVFEKFNFVLVLKRQFEGEVTLATVLTF